MTRQKKHIRRSKYGKPFRAGHRVPVMDKTSTWKESVGAQRIGEGIEMGWDKLGEEKSLVIVEPPDIGMRWMVAVVTPEEDWKRLKLVKTRGQAIAFSKVWMKRN